MHEAVSKTVPSNNIFFKTAYLKKKTVRGL